MAVLLINAFIELWAQADDAHRTHFFFPDWVENPVALRIPELPSQLELIGGVFMEQLGGLLDGHLQSGDLFGIEVGDAVKAGWLLPVKWIDGRGCHHRLRHLVHD